MFADLKIITGACAMACLTTTGAIADSVPVRWTPPSGMEPGPIDGTEAKIVTSAAGVGSEISTTGLPPGHVLTVWFVAIQDPEGCSQRPCTPPDGMGKAELVRTVVRNAGGGVVAPDGSFWHASFTGAGEVPGNFFDMPFDSPETAEIHLAIQDHGPLIPERASEMMSTYRAGCTDDSVPPFYPDTARADGMAGEYPCKVLQFAVLIQDATNTN